MIKDINSAKRCPLRASSISPDMPVYCVESSCAWWVDDPTVAIQMGKCSIKAIAEKLSAINGHDRITD